MSAILDIGCGENKLEGSVGLDIDPESNADHIHDAHDLPFPDQRFDLAVSRFNIEHLENPGIAIQEMMRVAKHCQILTDDASHWRLQTVIRHSHMKESGSGHTAIYQPEHLVTLITRMGGEIEEIIRQRSKKKLDRFLWLIPMFRPFLYRSFTIKFHKKEV